MSDKHRFSSFVAPSYDGGADVAQRDWQLPKSPSVEAAEDISAAFLSTPAIPKDKRGGPALFEGFVDPHEFFED